MLHFLYSEGFIIWQGTSDADKGLSHRFDVLAVFNGVHGKKPVGFVQECGDRFLSCGRDGCIRQYLYNDEMGEFTACGDDRSANVTMVEVRNRTNVLIIGQRQCIMS